MKVPFPPATYAVPGDSPHLLDYREVNGKPDEYIALMFNPSVKDRFGVGEWDGMGLSAGTVRYFRHLRNAIEAMEEWAGSRKLPKRAL